MDEGPIDPFNPYGRRYSQQPWPPRAADDTQEVPVVAAPRADDTQEVPVVAAPVAEPPPPAVPGYGEVPPPSVASASAAPGPEGPPPWPTGISEPTTATPAPVGFEPEPTVPPRPATGGRSRRPLLLAGVGVAALVVVIAVAVFVLLPGSGVDGDGAAAKEPATSASAESSDASGSPEESVSPSKKSEPEPDKSPSKQADDDDADDGEPPPKPDLTVPSRPTKFGAWFAGGGSYQAKWGKPANDGGADIVSYVVGDCKGNNLAFTDANTFTATVSADRLNCMSVYAVNSQGLGQDAQHQIDNNP